MTTTPRFKIEYLPAVDWSTRSHPSARQWGVKRHRRGCWVKLGRRGFSVWWRDVR
ncbi:hypothetical protein [Gordonia sp. UCD-TK1]|uniref:hypothetical protein n=1 Tax=Gordonia sp. UCD-TK1 TaxID=1857893 RepID=UPI001585D40D|nr:hypothetical protein [Gordonia sp. UCD-TK1]